MIFQGIIAILKNNNIKVIIHEPTLNAEDFEECEVIKSFDDFAEMSDVIIANRLDDNMKSIEDKIYTRYLFTID